MAGLTSFSKVDVSRLDVDSDDEDKPKADPTGAMQGMLDGNQLPEHIDMEQMMGGMNAMGDNVPGIQGQDWDEYKVTALEPGDVGKTFDCSAGKRQMTKTLLVAGKYADFDNPTTLWVAKIRYTGKLIASGEVFDAAHAATARLVTVGSGALPPFLEKALKTMKRGERARFVVQPELAWGEAGEPGLGVPPGAAVEYEIELLALHEVVDLAEGAIRKKTTVRPSGPNTWELPDALAEISCSWRGEVAATGFVFRGDAPFEYARSDPSLPPFWKEVSMKRGETAEYLVKAPMAFGSTGEAALGVPPDADVKILITMRDWLNLEDVSPQRDGAAIKVVLAPGEGWMRPSTRYECTVDIQVSVFGGKASVHGAASAQPEPAAAVASAEGVVVTLGSERIEPAVEAASQAAGVGTWGVGAALDLLLPRMCKGETAALRCSQAMIGGPHARVDVRVKLHSWVRVEVVPHTLEAVVRRVVREAAENQYDRPNEDATCVVRYSVRLASGAEPVHALEAPATIVQGDAQALPCIEAAVCEMKRGEVCILRAPAEWGFGADGSFPRPAGLPAAARESAVEVELELLDFVRGKDPFDMDVSEKMKSQLKRKEQGNALFKRGEIERAARRYEASNSRAPTDTDFAKESAADAKESASAQAGAAEAGAVQAGAAQAGAAEVGADAAEAGGAPAGAATEREAQQRAEVKKVKLACFVNLAACQLKLGRHVEAAAACSSALELESSSAKALFRRGQARLALSDFAEARADLVAAAKADPTSREVRQCLEEVKQRQAQAEAKDRATYGKLFK